MKLKTKLFTFGTIACITAASAFSATILKYFSPNSDGTRDVLEIPFSASDDGRIVAWKMVIENSHGKTVRTIGNKMSLPSKITAGGVLKQLVTPKESVIIPESVIWDGTLDDGTMAPDGEYFYYISVTDETGNEQTTKKYNVFLDNTKPEINVTVPDGDNLVFGEGNKATFQIKQTGSKEKSWKGVISTLDGKAVRTIFWNDNKPQNFIWDGTDDSGMIVPDGVYNYEISGTDKAGNSSENAGIKNIIFSAEKPVTDIDLAGAKYFSIPSKSDQTKITLEVNIPSPKNANKLVDWSITIFDQNKNPVKTYNPETTGQNVPPQKIEFDGKNENGLYVAEGEYYAQVKAKYLNGYETAPVNSASFMFDMTPPYARVTASEKIFSPDGDGRKDVVLFNILSENKKGSPIKSWKGKIVNTNDPETPVREYNFGLTAPDTVEWNGVDKNGRLAQDGQYDFIITGCDMAGNSITEKTVEHFALDTTKTEVMLAVNEKEFSPNADGTKDTIVFSPIVKDSSNIAKYNFEIKNSRKETVFFKTENSVPPKQIEWDGTKNGKKLTDGTYSAILVCESKNGSISKSEIPNLILDTVSPEVELNYSDKIFSPDGDGLKDNFIIVTSGCSVEDLWKTEIKDSKGKTVKTLNYPKTLGDPNTKNLIWDGTDEFGNRLSDGTYSVTVSSTDKAGNTFTKTIDSITLDAREVKAFVTVSSEGFSPLSVTGKTEQHIALRTSVPDGIKQWKVDIVKNDGTVVWTKESEINSTSLPKEIIWDGKTKDGNNADGKFTARLSMEYLKGNKLEEKSAAFICSTKAPDLSVKTTPDFFSPDNDGTDDDLNIKLKAECEGKIESWSFVINNPDESGRAGKPFWKTEGKSTMTESLTWNGLSNIYKEKNGQAERVASAMDYPYEFTVTDSLGLTNTVRGKISIDILVIRDGAVLKMAVPSIIFRANNADFKTAKEEPGSKVTPEQAANNERVLKRVADILKKFPDYTITVAGHANNITGTEEEETGGNIPLVPLSKARAEFVKTKLASYGIEESRMTTVGKGGRERIASLKDTENWWKNRRVEFLLNKPLVPSNAH